MESYAIEIPESRVRLMRRRALLSPEAQKKLEDEVENRVNLHRAQKAVKMDVGGDLTSGENICGRLYYGRTEVEPPHMESVYILCEAVAKNGQQVAMTVTLRVWADWKCYEAVLWNKGMVARVCGEVGRRGINFSTRSQTEVQTASVLMWLRLRGKFFYDADLKAFETSLYFDRQKKLLWRIESPEFKTWLHEHSRVNSCRSDFDHLMSEIHSSALNPEVSRPCKPRALFNRRQIDGVDFIYISCGPRWIYKIGASKDGQNIVKVPNGTDDVVFLTNQVLDEWDLLDGDGADPCETCAPFSTANYEYNHGRMIVRLWMLSLAACQAAFPAILFTGKARSGKTRLAKAVCELFGCPHRSASIDPGSAGKKDGWTIVNAGGIVNFDNVDTRIDWFSDFVQQVCTDGSFESRTLFKDAQITTLKANARVILTSNNPMFAAEAGLSDRLQIVRLLPFDGRNGKEVSDAALTVEIKAKRDASLTWMARTISRALADQDAVDGNVCFRHPDFANFALRCARALLKDDGSNLYQSAVMALKSAEFDKARLTIQNVKCTKLILEALEYAFVKKIDLTNGVWKGRATEMLNLIVKSHENMNNGEGRSGEAPNVNSIGHYLDKYIEQFSIIFDIGSINRQVGSGVEYTFNGFSAAYKACILGDSVKVPKIECCQNEGIELPF